MRQLWAIVIILTLTLSASAQSLNTTTTSGGLSLSHPSSWTAEELDPLTLTLTDAANWRIVISAGSDAFYEISGEDPPTTPAEAMQPFTDALKLEGAVIPNETPLRFQLGSRSALQQSAVTNTGRSIEIITFNLDDGTVMLGLLGSDSGATVIPPKVRSLFHAVLDSVTLSEPSTLRFSSGVELTYPEGWALASENRSSITLFYGESIVFSEALLTITVINSAELTLEAFRDSSLSILAMLHTGREDYDAARDVIMATLPDGRTIMYLDTSAAKSQTGNIYLISVNADYWMSLALINLPAVGNSAQRAEDVMSMIASITMHQPGLPNSAANSSTADSGDAMSSTAVGETDGMLPASGVGQYQVISVTNTCEDELPLADAWLPSDGSLHELMFSVRENVALELHHVVAPVEIAETPDFFTVDDAEIGNFLVIPGIQTEPYSYLYRVVSLDFVTLDYIQTLALSDCMLTVLAELRRVDTPAAAALEDDAIVMADLSEWELFGDAVAYANDLPDDFPENRLCGRDLSQGETWMFRAPETFVGQIGSFYGGTLSYDLYLLEDGDLFEDVDAEIVIGNGIVLAYRLETSPTSGEWVTLTLPLTVDTGWFDVDGYMDTTNPDLMHEMLVNATQLYLRGEYVIGADAACLANVRLNR